MAAGWLKALDDPAVGGRVKIVGLVDPNLAAAEKLKSEFQLADASVSADLVAALSSLKPEIVFDVAIPAARLNIVKTAFAHGCHVLTEKPMATSLADAREINAAARATGRLHAVTQNRRFKENIRRARATVESGILGTITALHCDFFIGAHFGGFREDMEHVLLLDMAIHTFDAARFISGQEPLAVYCLETNPTGSWYAHGAAANAIFEFTGDVVVTYRGSWCAEGANTNWDSSWRIVGTNGTLLWDGEAGFVAKLVDGDEGFFRPLREVEIPPPANERETHGHASVIADFLDAVDTGDTPETAGDDNIKSLAMVFAAIESARARQRISVKA
jgi:predicted dehydrogenase